MVFLLFYFSNCTYSSESVSLLLSLFSKSYVTSQAISHTSSLFVIYQSKKEKKKEIFFVTSSVVKYDFLKSERKSSLIFFSFNWIRIKLEILVQYLSWCDRVAINPFTIKYPIYNFPSIMVF